MQNVAKYAQKHGGVENGQTHSYNGGYEDDFARLQETSKSFLKSLKTPEQRIKNLMKECESDIQEAYKKNWDVKLIAIPMSMNLL